MSKIQHIIYLRDCLMAGQRLDSNRIIELLKDEYDAKVDKRTAQRYIIELKEMQDLFVEETSEGKKKIIYISGENRRSFRETNPLPNPGNYLLSLNVLKAHLKSFAGTKIEKNTNELISEIEKVTKNKAEIFTSKSLFWNQNQGSYDYSTHAKTIDHITDIITQQKFQYVKYGNPEKPSNFVALLSEFFSYNGSLYVAAYTPRHGHHIALAVQNIHRLSELSKEDKEKYQEVEIPIFTFESFTKDRFGVHHGPIRNVRLEVSHEYKHYFLNRTFHVSQVNQYEDDPDQQMQINLEVPLSPELISWILSWGGELQVVAPTKLKEKVAEKAQRMV